jgi:putative peptidoglycan lipid II flippase
VIGLGFVGLKLLSFGGGASARESITIDTAILTESIAPTTVAAPTGQIWPILAVRSYDPFGDDNGNGRPDKRKGTENDADAINAIDGNPETGWQTARYGTADLDGKGGVGIVFDLGEPRPIQSALLVFDGTGTSAQIRVSNDIQPDPALWSSVATVDGAGEQIEIRSPRPVTGRYVLVWFTKLPASGSGYRGGLKEATFRS